MADLSAYLDPVGGGNAPSALPRNHAEAVSGFLAAMEAAGIRSIEPISGALKNGQLIRFRSQGDKPGRKNAWAVIHMDQSPHGSFGSHRLGVSQNWRARAEFRERCMFRPAQTAERDDRMEAQKRAKSEAASLRANEIWQQSVLASPDHGYMVSKQLAGDSIRQFHDKLVVPMRDIQGRLANLQLIAEDGQKRFLPGGQTAGLFWLAGKPGAVICVGEGMATMAAVRRATGHAVAAAMSAKNLEAVARAIRARAPTLDIILCADDDAHRADNPGVNAAKAAANAVGGKVAYPPRRTQ